jgi:hypothetical protein
MKYAVEMGSGAMIYVDTEFHKDLFSFSKADIGDTHTKTDSMKIA